VKRALFLVLVSGLILAVVCPLFPEKITFIHSNDTHGNFKSYKTNVEGGERLIGGMEATSHYINQIRAREKNVLLIETGDMLTGTLAAEIEYEGVAGGAMIEFLNRLEYDVWSYGNHDFDRGQRNALGLAKLAKFPTVMANIIYKKSGKLFPAEPYHIFETGGIKVGVIAVMEENFLTEVEKEIVEGLDVLPIIPTLNSYIPELDKKTDLIVVIAHGWFDEGLRIAKNVEGVDVVLVAAEDGKFKDVDGVLVKSTKGHQETLGYLRVEVDNDKVIGYEERLIWLWADIDLKPSPQVAALVREVDDLVGEEYAKVIGEAKADLTVNYYPGEDIFVESTLGNWITDVMRWKTGAQVGFHNTGAIRADIKAGPVTKSNVFDVAPFHNTLVVFKLTGEQLKDALEADVERGWDRMQVSGIKYKYYPKEVKPYGERIDYAEINREVLVKKGKVLWPGKVYIIVSNNYLVGHAEEKYLGFPVDNHKDTGVLLDIVLMEWLDKYKVLDYKIEERIEEIR
jgi:2',3'-cyclic-nucleotide 2'-phosphodiesterase (5'-nucleotidase family)